MIGLSPSTLAGSHPLQPWGQDPEVVSGFPSRGENAAGLGRGKGDGSFVQGLGEFCFPRGASVALVEREAVSLYFEVRCIFYCELTEYIYGYKYSCVAERCTLYVLPF